jgi:hypothetical protein
VKKKEQFERKKKSFSFCLHSNETKTLGCSLIFFMNNNLLEEEKVKLLYTKSIQEKQPPYWVENLKS